MKRNWYRIIYNTLVTMFSLALFIIMYVVFGSMLGYMAVSIIFGLIFLGAVAFVGIGTLQYMADEWDRENKN